MFLVNIPTILAWLMLYIGTSKELIIAAFALLGLGTGLVEAPCNTYFGEIWYVAFAVGINRKWRLAKLVIFAVIHRCVACWSPSRVSRQRPECLSYFCSAVSLRGEMWPWSVHLYRHLPCWPFCLWVSFVTLFPVPQFDCYLYYRPFWPIHHRSPKVRYGCYRRTVRTMLAGRCNGYAAGSHQKLELESG